MITDQVRWGFTWHIHTNRQTQDYHVSIISYLGSSLNAGYFKWPWIIIVEKCMNRSAHDQPRKENHLHPLTNWDDRIHCIAMPLYYISLLQQGMWGTLNGVFPDDTNITTSLPPPLLSAGIGTVQVQYSTVCITGLSLVCNAAELNLNNHSQEAKVSKTDRTVTIIGWQTSTWHRIVYIWQIDQENSCKESEVSSSSSDVKLNNLRKCRLIKQTRPHQR